MVILLIGSTVLTVWMVWYELANGLFSRSGEYVAGLAPRVLLALLSWRAFRAAKAWPSLNSKSAASISVLDEGEPLEPPWIR